jgi:hypothetical protein
VVSSVLLVRLENVLDEAWIKVAAYTAEFETYDTSSRLDGLPDKGSSTPLTSESWTAFPDENSSFHVFPSIRAIFHTTSPIDPHQRHPRVASKSKFESPSRIERPEGESFK